MNNAVIETRIPARLDRLPFSRWHVLLILALGITWILDGLEVTVVGNIAAVLTQPESGLGLRAGQIGQAAALYIAGACLGALLFAWLTDRYGRKRLFLITLAVYLLFTLLSAMAWNFSSFALFRFLAGMGIGGEYAAIYSAIDELMPARLRGRVALAISGSYWIGAMLGSAASILLLDPARVPVAYGWRLAFGLGAVLGFAVLLIRRYVPESPRWLLTHGRFQEAERITQTIEDQIGRGAGARLAPVTSPPLRVHPRAYTGFAPILRVMLRLYPRRSLLGLILMAAQAFLYNAVFFTYALILQDFYGVPAAHIGYYIFPFALGNLLGPLLLGRFFDSIGRVPMITGTYLLSSLLMAATGLLFAQGLLSAFSQTALWTLIFFFASAAASAAYLTISEVFPLETRALAIAVYYAFGTALGGISGPLLFGHLIEQGDRQALLTGYLIGAGAMLVAGLAEWRLGVRAEGRALEELALPLCAREERG